MLQNQDIPIDEIYIGCVELDRKEFKKPQKIGQKTGLLTLRIGKISTEKAGIKTDKNNNVYESYGKAPIFVGVKEFEEFKKNHPTVKTPHDLFVQVINA